MEVLFTFTSLRRHFPTFLLLLLCDPRNRYSIKKKEGEKSLKQDFRSTDLKGKSDRTINKHVS